MGGRYGEGLSDSHTCLPAFLRILSPFFIQDTRTPDHTPVAVFSAVCNVVSGRVRRTSHQLAAVLLSGFMETLAGSSSIINKSHKVRTLHKLQRTALLNKAALFDRFSLWKREIKAERIMAHAALHTECCFSKYAVVSQ